MSNKHFLGGRGSRKPITPIEKLIRQAADAIKEKEAKAKRAQEAK